MKKFLAFLMSFVLIFSTIGIPKAVLAKENYSTRSRKDVLNYLENSKIKEFAKTPESIRAYENVKKNAIAFSKSDVYVKFDNLDNTVKPIKYTEEQYTRNLLTTTLNAKLPGDPSDSGNRYSWIKLTIEHYKNSDGSYLFCGFFNWLTKPFFTGEDVIALGHDSSISFDTDSTFGYYQCEYMLSDGNTTASAHTFDFSKDKRNTTASTLGAAAMFNLQKTADSTPTTNSGAIYCTGWINGSRGNLQVSYGHSELSVSTSIEASLTWLPTGGIKFDVKGTQDMATHGNYVS